MTPVRLLVLLGLSLLAAACAPLGDTPAPPQARNVLFIMGDDHAAYALGAYGSPIAQTPHLDRLAAEGFRFDRSYANAPVCTPSRQSILTSRLPHAAGVNLLFTPLSVEQVTIADHLLERGYRTGAIGKMHFNSSEGALRNWGYPDSVIALADDHHGFTTRIDRGDYRAHLAAQPPTPPPDTLATRPPWRPFRDPARTWLNAEARPSAHFDEDSEGTYFARQAIDFLQTHQDDPFVLWLSFYEPHSPFNFPIEYAGRFDPDTMPVPAVGTEDGRWIPAIFRDLTESEKQGIIAAYYTSVAYLDKNVGLVLEELDRLGLADSTLVVYVGDHGYLLGHHGRFEKHMMWEEAVRAPLLMRGPGITPGEHSTALVEFIDLVPTILDVLGEPPMPTAQGRSLCPVLDDPATPHRPYVFSEFLTDNKAMVRTDRWKYIFATGARDLGQGYATGFPPPGITHRLYDLQHDPAETHDLAADPAYRDTLRTLQGYMLDRFQSTHPDADQLPAGLSIDEQLAWFCEPRDPQPAVAIQ